MRAAVYRKYGPPSVLHLDELETPSPGPGEILLRVAATEVTKSDCELRKMRFPVAWLSIPLRLVFGWFRPRRPVLGAYLAGTVVSRGDRVTRFEVGDAVYGSTGFRFGGYGEYVAVSEDAALSPMPSGLSPSQAASMPLGGLNALHFMRHAKIRAGERMLIVGAGGSIGVSALQIAKAEGARVTVVDAAHKLAWLRRLGADETLDFRKDTPLAAAAQYDIIFSVIAANHYARCLRALKPGGRFLTANPRFVDLLRAPFTNRFGKKRVTVAFASESIADLQELTQMLERGTLRPVVDREFPLEDAAEAHTRVEDEQRLGAVILRVEAATPSA